MNATVKVRRIVCAALLLPLLVACGDEESTAPEVDGTATHRLVVHIAGDGDRAVAVTFSADSAWVAAVPGFRVFAHTFRGQVGIVALPDGPGALPRGDVVVATLGLSGEAESAAEPTVRQVANVDYELAQIEGYSARLERVGR